MRRGLLETRAAAQAAVDAGLVLVGGAVGDNPARLVAPGESLALVGPPARFVSRGGEKLDAALDRFAIDVRGTRCLDAGASTGGFTDCLLQRGAASVVALDVGHGLLHERLRADDRVVVIERTNLRLVTAGELGAPFAVVVADLSFISLRTVAPALVGQAAPGAEVVALVKPQFEVGRAEVSKGRGVVREPAAWRGAVVKVARAMDGAGAAMIDLMVSPLRGADGNLELLAHLRVGAPAQSVEGLLDAAFCGLG